MSTWDELRPVLRELSARRPSPLYYSPGLDQRFEQPPFRLGLAPWAEDVAAQLTRQFGDEVHIAVGRLPYPLREPPARLRAAQQAGAAMQAKLPLLDAGGVTVTLDGPAVVRSGYELRHGLLLRNRTGSELQVETNGHLTADVFDPETGERVGGVARPQGASLIVFRAAPGETVRVPLLTGTASSTPRLGYLIPPGEWHMEARVRLGPYPRDSPFRRTPRLPLTVTASLE